MPAFESSGEVDTGGSTVTSLAISNVTLTGSNRSLYLSQSARFNSQNALTPTRTGDTFTEIAEYNQTTGGGTLYMSLWVSTNQPGTSAQTLTFNAASGATWGGQYIACTGVNQTTRYENLTRNTDELATSGMDAMDVTSHTGDLVLDTVAAINSATIGSPTGTSHTERIASTFPSTSWAMKMGSTPGASTVSIGWAITGSTDCATHYAWSVPSDATPPINTVPPLPYSTSALRDTAISGFAITEGTTPVSSATLSVPSGKGVWTLTASGSVSLSGNGTNSVVLTGGASTAEFVTVLNSAVFRGGAVHEAITATLLSSDGTLTDSDTFTLLNDVRNLTVTCAASKYAKMQAFIASLQVWLDEGQTSDVATATLEDSGGRTDEQTIIIGIYSFDQISPLSVKASSTFSKVFTVTLASTSLTEVSNDASIEAALLIGGLFTGLSYDQVTKLNAKQFSLRLYGDLPLGSNFGIIGLNGSEVE